MRIRTRFVRNAAVIATAVVIGATVGSVGAQIASTPATGPGSSQCTAVASLPCPALPSGQWYDLNIGRSATLAAVRCDDGSGTWMPADITLTAMLPGGHENVSEFATWCVPVADPTAPGTGLPWSDLFTRVAFDAQP